MREMGKDERDYWTQPEARPLDIRNGALLVCPDMCPCALLSAVASASTGQKISSITSDDLLSHSIFSLKETHELKAGVSASTKRSRSDPFSARSGEY